MDPKAENLRKSKQEVVEKAYSVVSKMSRVSKVYFDPDKENEEHLHKMYKKGHFSIKIIEKILNEMISAAIENGVEINEDQEMTLIEQVHLTFVPLLTLVHCYRHRRSIPDLQSPVFNEALKKGINKLKNSNPEALTMITHNFEKRRDHHTIFLSLLNYIKNDLKKINQTQHEFYMHLLRTENLRLLSAYEVYIVREELDDFINTLDLIYKNNFDGNLSEGSFLDNGDLREKQNSILFQYKTRIKKPYYEKLIEMIKNGDQKTFELYEKYCKGMMDHFGVKGGKNKDFRVLFAQELESYARKALRREKEFNKIAQKEETKKKKEVVQTSGGFLTASNAQKAQKIEKDVEKIVDNVAKKVETDGKKAKKLEKDVEKIVDNVAQKIVLDSKWRGDFMFYADLYMSKIGLAKSNLMKNTVDKYTNEAKEILYNFRQENDKEEFEKKTDELLNKYIKNRYYKDDSIGGFSKVLLEKGIPVYQIYKLDLAMNDPSHAYNVQLNQIIELYNVMEDEEYLISNIEILLKKF